MLDKEIEAGTMIVNFFDYYFLTNLIFNLAIIINLEVLKELIEVQKIDVIVIKVLEHVDIKQIVNVDYSMENFKNYYYLKLYLNLKV